MLVKNKYIFRIKENVDKDINYLFFIVLNMLIQIVFDLTLGIWEVID